MLEEVMFLDNEYRLWLNIFFVELNLRGCLDNYKEKLVGMICVDIEVYACGIYLCFCL